MKIIIKNLIEESEKEVAKAFNCNENCVKVFGDTAVIEKKKLNLNRKSQLYKLKNGESIYSVARKFNVPEKILKDANENIEFFGGLTCYIPKYSGKTYQVTILDTIKSVAEKNNISIEKLKELNDISFIFAGQLLIVD